MSLAPLLEGETSVPEPVSAAEAPRRARPRRYLMCRPTYFDVVYEINPWMDIAVAVDTDLAMAQWESLRRTYLELGHRVDVVEGVPGLPDMVFAANAGTVIDGRVLNARMRSAHRAGEEQPYLDWFRSAFADVGYPERVNEGEGDFLWTGALLLAGTGFRTDPLAHAETAEALGVPTVGLQLVDPHFYHLDTALTVLAEDLIAYHPPAFSPGSQAALRRLYPDAIVVDADDARWFGLNAVSDGYNVVVAEQAKGMINALRERGFNPCPVDVSEFRKAGGGAKCCTLELRD